MSLKSRQLGQTKSIRLTNTTLTLTGTPTTPGACAPFGQTVALLQNGKLTEWVSTGEVWRPLGVMIMATTTVTVTAPVYTLQKAANSLTTAPTFASASSGGVATGTLQVAPNTNYYPFTDYIGADGVSNFTADAAGDNWAVNVSTSPSAGAAHISLCYVNINVSGISDAVTTL